MAADFYAEWVSVASDEARHFTMLRERLRESGHDYGDFDAHNGLWEMAEKTAHDGLARMALVPRVLEARGLDRSEEHTSELQSLMRISYAVFCLKKKKKKTCHTYNQHTICVIKQ